MKFFSPDSKLYKAMQTLLDLIKINFLWLICALPIVTFGGATIAAFDVTMKMAAQEEGYVGRQFLRSFKANFKCGIPYGLVFLLGVYVVWLDFSLFEQVEGNPIILLCMGIIAVFSLLWSFLFAFALQARYENTFIRTLKNSADICSRYFVRTISLIVVLGVEIILIFWNTTTLFVGFLIGPACIIFTISGYAVYYFADLEREQGRMEFSNEKSEDK